MKKAETRGRPKNTPNKPKVITQNNIDKLEDAKLEHHIIQIQVKEPLRFFVEHYLRCEGYEVLSHTNEKVGVANDEPQQVRKLLYKLLEIVKEAKLVKEPKTNEWVLHI